MIKLPVLFVLLISAAAAAVAQGGKAEPNRVSFAAGKSSTTLTGTLSNEQEMEYIFSARAGQKVMIRNTRPSLFDFRVFNDQNDFDTEFESSPTLVFEIPETGDYLLFVRKKLVRSPRTGRFSITLTIK